MLQPSQAPGTEARSERRPHLIHLFLLSHGAQAGRLPHWAQDITENFPGTRHWKWCLHTGEVAMAVPVTMAFLHLSALTPTQGQPSEGHGEHSDER